MKIFNFNIQDPESYFSNEIEIKTHNQAYYKKILENPDIAKLLDKCSDEQIDAILNEEKELLLNAGAGSGKSSTLKKRAVYEAEFKNIPVEKILFLSYNKSISTQITEDFKKLDVPVVASTIHALGKEIYSYEEEYKKVVGEEEFSTFFEELSRKFEAGSSTEKFYDYINLSKNLLTEDGKYKQIKLHAYTTQRGELVKSFAEKAIADFLFSHSIDYRYEVILPDLSSKPDFYLPKYKIIIENWGLSKDGKVPEWFSGTSEDYEKARIKKTKAYVEKRYYLIDTWTYEFPEGSLIPNLKKNFVKARLPYENYEFKQLTDEEILKGKLKRLTKSELVFRFELIAKGIQFLLSQGFDKHYIAKIKEKNKLIIPFAMFCDLLEYALEQFEVWKKANSMMTFDDMILQAIPKLDKYPELYANRYNLILVDEFQDMSIKRFELIKKLYDKQQNCKVLCVGDDWQSIYAFSGTHVQLFLNFNSLFPNAVTKLLSYNFRSSSLIVDTGNKILQKNTKKSEKTIKAFKEFEKTSITLFLQNVYDEEKSIEHAYNLYLDLLNTGNKSSDIMVIARNNNILYKFKSKFPKEDKELRVLTIHSSKGLEAKFVIILEVLKDVFPSTVTDPVDIRLLKEIGNAEDWIEEERRLFYVAITRAEQHIFVYTAKDKVSRFVSEIKESLTKVEEI